MTDNAYRFSGYQLDLIQLDSTGPAFAVSYVHPSLINQPEYYQKPAYQGTSVVITGGLVSDAVDPSTFHISPIGHLYDML